MMSKGALEQGEGCVDQIFTLKQIGDKAREKNAVYVCFIDLEKVYDRVNREALWQVLRMYEMKKILINCLESLCDRCRSCVNWGRS